MIIFLKRVDGNMILCVYSVKRVSLFPANLILPFCQKTKDDLLLKNAIKDDIFNIIEKDHIHPRKKNSLLSNKLLIINLHSLICHLLETCP